MRDYIELDHLIYHFQTAYAYCVSTEEDEFGKEAERIFLDKNQVEKDGDIFKMSERYAEQKGLL